MLDPNSSSHSCIKNRKNRVILSCTGKRTDLPAQLLTKVVILSHRHWTTKRIRPHPLQNQLSSSHFPSSTVATFNLNAHILNLLNSTWQLTLPWLSALFQQLLSLGVVWWSGKAVLRQYHDIFRSSAGKNKQEDKEITLQAHMPFFWANMQAAVFKCKSAVFSEWTTLLLMKEEAGDTSEERIWNRKRGKE